MDQQLEKLTQKIDILAGQVAYLTEQAQLVERQRQERTELIHDLTPIANQAFHMTIEQLEEVQESIDLGDLLRLLKRLLRNGRNLEKALNQFESIMDLLDSLGPMRDEAFTKVINLMAELEGKGYFNLAHGGLRIADKVASSFGEEDVIRLEDTIVPILKKMSQPEAINFIDSTILAVEQEMAKPVDVSYMGIVHQLRDPDVRRGLALTLRVLQVVGSQSSGIQQGQMEHLGASA